MVVVVVVVVHSALFFLENPRIYEIKRFLKKKEKKKQIKSKPRNPVLTLAQTPSHQTKRRGKKQPQNLVFPWWWEFKCFIQHREEDGMRMDMDMDMDMTLSHTCTQTLFVVDHYRYHFKMFFSLPRGCFSPTYCFHSDAVALCIRCTLLHFFDYIFNSF